MFRNQSRDIAIFGRDRGEGGKRCISRLKNGCYASLGLVCAIEEEEDMGQELHFIGRVVAQKT